MFMTNQAQNVMLRDDNKTPPAAEVRGKVREFIGVKDGDNGSTAGDVGAKRLLLGFAPAGRGRVILEASSLQSSIALGVTKLIAGSHKSAIPTGATTGFPVIIPDTELGATAAVTANTTAAIVPAAANAVIGWKYVSLDDIPIILEAANDFTAASIVKARIVFVQE